MASIVYTSHLYIYHSVFGKPATWGEEFAEALADFYAWALLSPAILYLAARFPLQPNRWQRSLLVHIPASLLVSLAQVVIHTVADQSLIHGHYSLDAMASGFQALFARTFHFGLLVYWMIIGISHAIEYYRDRELAAAQMETQLAQAQLNALKMQLHPHFLFNTLHAISALMHEDVKAADEMIARLSELLRISMTATNDQEVTLKTEIEFLDKYLEVERIRFKDRLTVRMNIDPQALDASVPNLILQPLVENSIRHGISKRRGAGLVEIRALRQNGALQLQIIDNGVGLPTDEEAVIKEGVGLSNTRARLEQLYGAQHRLELTKPAEGGLIVTIIIPFHNLATE
jgi:LytS/YehU family sensor histidine kinase